MAITKKVLRARAEKEAAAKKAEADQDYLNSFGFTYGDIVRVEGIRSEFKIVGVGGDGSITTIDQSDHSFRSFRPEWCYPAWRINRRGRKVKTICPPSVKGLRGQWLTEAGLQF